MSLRRTPGAIGSSRSGTKIPSRLTIAGQMGNSGSRVAMRFTVSPSPRLLSMKTLFSFYSTQRTRRLKVLVNQSMLCTGLLPLIIGTAQIEGVFLRQTYGYGLGGMTTVEYRPYLLLKDGTYWKKFDVSPDDLNVVKSRQSDPSEWGKWKRDGDKFAVYEKEKWVTTKMTPAGSAGPSDRLDGTYRTSTGGGNVALGGDSMIALSKAYHFQPNGAFEVAASASGSKSDVITTSKAKAKGTYTISGYTITFKFSDGTAAKAPFMFMDTKNKKGFLIGRSPFTQRKAK